MANVFKINSSSLKIPVVSSDPSSPSDGEMWYNSTSREFKFRSNGSTTEFGVTIAADVTYDNTDNVFLTDTDVQGVLDQIEALIGANSGLATLDANGKLPVAQLPTSAMEYKGAYDATTHDPALADGAGDAGDMYRVSVAGSHDFGSGSISLSIGDVIIYNGSIWEKIPGSDLVISVNGQTGPVSLDSDDISEGSSNLYFTEARVLATQLSGHAASAGTVADGDAIDVALEKLDGNIAAKMDEVADDTTPTLGGDLDLSTFKMSSANHEIENSSVSLTASTTAVLMSMAHASFEGAMIDYKIKKSTGVSVGRLYVATDGTNASITDVGTETVAIGVSFSAAVNGVNLEVSYTNDATEGVMKSEIKKLKA